MKLGTKVELGTLKGSGAMGWNVVRIFGAHCLEAVAELERAGAVMYCPVVVQVKRVGRARSAKVVVRAPAYLGWAFMLGEPDPRKVAPWVRWRPVGVPIKNEVIEQVKSDEAEWNHKAMEQVVEKPREKFNAGDVVLVTGGLLKGSRLVVESDQGDHVILITSTGNFSGKISLSTFLAEKIGA